MHQPAHNVETATTARATYLRIRNCVYALFLISASSSAVRLFLCQFTTILMITWFFFSYFLECKDSCEMHA